MKRYYKNKIEQFMNDISAIIVASVFITINVAIMTAAWIGGSLGMTLIFLGCSVVSILIFGFKLVRIYKDLTNFMQSVEDFEEMIRHDHRPNA